jgi:PAS domain S-box-containing protein
MQRLKTTYRISFMLAGMSVLPLYLFGLDRTEDTRIQKLVESRASMCQQLALATSLHMRRQDQAAIAQQLQQFKEITPLALSARVVRFDGLVLAAVGDHASAWHLDPQQGSTLTNLRIAIRRDGREWGNLEAAFQDDQPRWGAAWHGIVVMVSVMSLNFIIFMLVLRRTINVLDPSSTVPRRVRNTLDTIAGGVVVLDAQQRIVLANEAFAKYFATAPNELVGKSLDGFAWQSEDITSLPWHRAIDRNEPCSGETLSLKNPEQSEKWFVVNATPVYDSNDKLAGALISFEDVTILEEQRQTLVEAMQELETSREQTTSRAGLARCADRHHEPSRVVRAVGRALDGARRNGRSARLYDAGRRPLQALERHAWARDRRRRAQERCPRAGEDGRRPRSGRPLRW